MQIRLHHQIFLLIECGWVVQDNCYRLKWYDGKASPTTVEDICRDDSQNDIAVVC